jgi:hypothetical protein
VRETVARYGDLRLIENDDLVLVRGTLPIEHEGKILDRFQIEIRLTNEFPDELPKVCEVGGRIPWTLDHHVFPNSGLACIQVPEEWLLARDRSFRAFLEVPVRNYYLGQALVALGEAWPFGERAHGLEGLYQSYGEMIGETDPERIVHYFTCLAANRLRGHWECPCGSGQRVRKCCDERLRNLRAVISPKLARSALDRMRQAASIARTHISVRSLQR